MSRDAGIEETSHVRIGEIVHGTAYKPLGGRKFLVKCNRFAFDWTVQVLARNPDDVEIGVNSPFWVAKIAPAKKSALLYLGEHGRMPISPSMAPRYTAAIKALLGDEPLTIDAIADAKNMIVRLQKQDTADWLTVYRMLKEPGAGDVKFMLARLDVLKEALKTDPNSLEGHRLGFIEDFGAGLRNAVNRLKD